MTRPEIMVAPTGARRTQADHPKLPLAIPEVVKTASACHAAGADALHLHVRDREGAHSLDPGLYAEALGELSRNVPAMCVQITTESAGRFSVSDQLACLAVLRPAWASISVREIAREPELAPRVYGTCADNGTKVQHILYDAADLALFLEWRTSGVIGAGPASAILVLGRYADGPVSRPEDVQPRAQALPEDVDWMLCAFGPAEHACLREAARLGGSCRVGMENSLVNAEGHPWRDNAASVAALVDSLASDAAGSRRLKP